MIKLLRVLVFILCANFVSAQNWVPLECGLNAEGRVLYPDSVTGKLFVGGDFSALGCHQSDRIAAWSGLEWDTTYSLNSYGNPVLTFNRYQNLLYTAGYFSNSCGTIITNGFARWNGSCWDSINNSFHTGTPSCMFQWNNLLYCLGEIDSVGCYFSPVVAAWDGNNWIPVGIPHYAGGSTEVGCIYQNELYMCGNFYDSIGVINGFAKYDGTNWTRVGGTFAGLVHTMAVYNNELYIGGNFFVNGPANYIVKWDGTNLSAVGSGLTTGLFKLRVIGDKLYGVGDNFIHVWDGNNWSVFTNDTFGNGINDIAVYNNEIYVTGGFLSINGDSSYNCIAKYQGWYLGEKIIKHNEGVKVYPNPTNTTINIYLSSYTTSETLLITDVLGEEIYKGTLSGIDNSIDVSKWSEGVYFITIISQDNIITQKFIKL